MKKQLLLLFACSLYNTKAQVNWIANGNPTTPLSIGITGANNFIGTTVGNPTSMRQGVNGSQDIFINNDPAQLLPANPNNPGVLQGGHWVGFGRIFTPGVGVGSNPLSAPRAHLHIHGGGLSAFPATGGFSQGLRNWFATGTLYTENSDGMYVGLRAVGTNQSYAVINWSDDATGGTGTDYLSFNFTGGPGNQPGTINGAELGRMSPTQGRGTFGIGNYQFINPGADPVRRLEILDADPTTGINVNAPQLRISYQYNTNAAQGIFSEFQTTANGDLYFNTRNTNIAQQARRFGFHSNTPGNTVEITSQPGVTGFPFAPFPSVNGASGLRFTNLTSGNTPLPNPGVGVLSVNAQGDVIYVPAALGVANNGLQITAGVVQLGGACNNFLQLASSVFQNDRAIITGNFNFWFANTNNQTGGVGIGGQPSSTPFCNTGNTFEVSANAKNTKYGNTNASGVRLTKLTSLSPALANGTNGLNNQKVLTVDQDGDVVLTNANGGFGNICGTNANPLASNWEVPTNNFNFRFINPPGTQAYNVNNIGIGTSCIPVAKLDILAAPTINTPALPIGLNVIQQNIGNNANYSGISSGIVATVSGNNLGNVGFSVTASGARINYGVLAQLSGNAASPSNVFNIAFRGQANNGQTNAGVQGLSTSNLASGTNYGGQFAANGAGTNYGVYSDCQGPSSTGNAVTSGVITSVNGVFNPSSYLYGIIASAPSPNGTNTTNNNNYAGFFNGGVYIAQTIFPSDEVIKKDKNDITSALSKIALIDPISYQFDTVLANQKGLSLPGGLQYGFKAQQVELVYPELVTMIHKPETRDTVGNIIKPSYDFKGVNYIGFIALLTKGVQEQKQTIDSLKSVTTKQDSINNALQAQINNIISTFSACCTNTASSRNTNNIGNSNSITSKQDIELSDKNVIVLNQNVPNPFAESTIITYNIPVDFKVAQIIFNSMDGRIIKAVDINQKGKGQLNVYANDLTNGLYSYYLIVDGKIIDTKKLVKQ